MVVEQLGKQVVLEKLGAEPTGLPFNSVTAIAAFSPRLDAAGNSVRAQKAIAYISQQLSINIFDPHSVGVE